MDKKDITGLLNDLITINKNRVTGYKEAVHAAKDDDTEPVALFKEMSRQSAHYIEELQERLKMLGGEVDDKTITSAVVYNTWMDLLYAEADGMKPDNKTFCMQLEETTLRAYESVSEKLKETENNLRDIVNNQKNGIRLSLELIKEL